MWAASWTALESRPSEIRQAGEDPVPESCLQKASAEREVGPGRARRAAACCMRDPRGASARPDGRPWK